MELFNIFWCLLGKFGAGYGIDAILCYPLGTDWIYKPLSL